MSSKNILVLTLLICQLGIYGFIQATTIHETEVLQVDGSKILGKWYQLNSITENDTFACSSNFIEPLSEAQYRINATMTLLPKPNQRLPPMPKSVVEFSGVITIQDDSFILVTRPGQSASWYVAVFDLDYDSHMVMYATTKKEITSSTMGMILVLCREKEIPSGLFDRIEQSNIYKNGVDSNFKLYPANTSGCE